MYVMSSSSSHSLETEFLDRLCVGSLNAAIIYAITICDSGLLCEIAFIAINIVQRGCYLTSQPFFRTEPVLF